MMMIWGVLCALAVGLGVVEAVLPRMVVEVAALLLTLQHNLLVLLLRVVVVAALLLTVELQRTVCRCSRYSCC